MFEFVVEVSIVYGNELSKNSNVTGPDTGEGDGWTITDASEGCCEGANVPNGLVVGVFEGTDVVGLFEGTNVPGLFEGLDVTGLFEGLDVTGLLEGVDVTGRFEGLWVVAVIRKENRDKINS